MKRLTMVASAGALLMLLVAGGGLFGQHDHEHDHAAPEEHGMPMMEAMPEPMRLKMRMMMAMEVEPTDPAALLAVAQQLELTPQQAEGLEKILANARAEAEEVLEPEQREQLRGLADLPSTHMGMHRMMMERMKERMEDREDGHGMMMDHRDGMMCPMCPMMRAMEEEEEAEAHEHGERHRHRPEAHGDHHR